MSTKNSGELWSTADVKLLKAMLKDKKSRKSIAKKLKRTEAGISKKMRMLFLVKTRGHGQREYFISDMDKVTEDAAIGSPMASVLNILARDGDIPVVPIPDKP